jgi:creatinine amidohydrolase/Fe(II)-dependent formamide hydrolase-like protein
VAAVISPPTIFAAFIEEGRESNPDIFHAGVFEMRSYRRVGAAVALALLFSAGAMHSAPVQAAAATANVEWELMTWPEIKAALAAGKTTALIYTGGVEQRGPQTTTGGHNMMSRPIVKAIAEKLGNAIAMPVLPFSPTGMSADLPGSLDLSIELLGPILERLTEDAIVNGFKTVILMGDHGSGQGPNGPYASIAKKLDDKYKASGVRVFYADEVYTKANSEFSDILVKEGYPQGAHAGILDTSMMMYLDTENKYVRRDQIANALGDPVLPRGQQPPAGYKPVNNGISGDARRSSAEIGKRFFDYKVEAAVKQIKALQASR